MLGDDLVLNLDDGTESEHYIDAIEAIESLSKIDNEIHEFYSASSICPLPEQPYDVGIYRQVIETRYLINTCDLSCRKDERKNPNKLKWGETTVNQPKTKAERILCQPTTKTATKAPPREHSSMKQKQAPCTIPDKAPTKYTCRKLNQFQAPSKYSGTISLLQSAGSILPSQPPPKISALERKRPCRTPKGPTKQENKCQYCNLPKTQCICEQNLEVSKPEKPVTVVVIPKNPISPECTCIPVKKLKKEKNVEEKVKPEIKTKLVGSKTTAVPKLKTEKPKQVEPVAVVKEVTETQEKPPKTKEPREEKPEQVEPKIQSEPEPIPVEEPIFVQKYVQPLTDGSEKAVDEKSLAESEKPSEKIMEVKEEIVSMKENIEPSIHEGQKEEASIHEEQKAEPSIHEEKKKEPSILEEEKIEPSLHEEIVEPSLHEEIVEPSLHEEKEAEPSIHEDKTVDPSIHEEEKVEVSIHKAEEILEASLKHEPAVVKIEEKQKLKKCLPCKAPCKTCSKVPRKTSQSRTKGQTGVASKVCHCCDVAINAPENVKEKGEQWEEKAKGKILICKGCWKTVKGIQKKCSTNVPSTSRPNTANKVYDYTRKQGSLCCQNKRSLTSLAKKMNNNQIAVRNCLQCKATLKTYPNVEKKSFSKTIASNQMLKQFCQCHNVAINTTQIEFLDKAQQCLERLPICKNSREKEGVPDKNMIASYVASDASNSESFPQQKFVIQTVLCQFTGYDNKDWCLRKERRSADQSKNCLNYRNSSFNFCSMQSEEIQVGPSCPSKCGEAQTTFVVTDIQNGRINYVCGPDVPGIRTKIAMNLNQLPSLQDAFNSNRLIDTENVSRECDSNCQNPGGKNPIDEDKEGCQVLKKDKFVFITVAEVQTEAYEPNYYIILTAPAEIAESSKKKRSSSADSRKKSKQKSCESVTSSDVPPKVKESISRLKKQILSIDTLKSGELLDFLAKTPELIQSLALMDTAGEVPQKNASAKELKDTCCGPEDCTETPRKSTLKEEPKKLTNTGCGPETFPKISTPPIEVGRRKDTGCGPETCLKKSAEINLEKKQQSDMALKKLIDTGCGPETCPKKTQPPQEKKIVETACGSVNCCIDCETTVMNGRQEKDTNTNNICGPNDCMHIEHKVKIPYCANKIFSTTQTERPSLITKEQTEYCEKAICTNICGKGAVIDENCVLKNENNYKTQFICQACQPGESFDKQYGRTSLDSAVREDKSVATCDACSCELEETSFDETLDESCEASCNLEVNSNNTETEEMLVETQDGHGCTDDTCEKIDSARRENEGSSGGCADNDCPEKGGKAKVKKEESLDLSIIIEDDEKVGSDDSIDKTKLNNTDLWALEIAMKRFDIIKPVVMEESDN